MPGADYHLGMTDAERDEAMRALEPSESAADLEARQKMMAEEKAKLVALLQAERNPKAASSDDVVGLVERLNNALLRVDGFTESPRDMVRLPYDDVRAAVAALERLPAQPRGDGDAVRIAAIEECVKVVGEYISSTDLAAPLNTGPWNAGRLAGAREVLAAIRALSPVSVEGEQGVGEQGGGA